jgi:hypothetical protein
MNIYSSLLFYVYFGPYLSFFLFFRPHRILILFSFFRFRFAFRFIFPHKKSA